MRKSLLVAGRQAGLSNAQNQEINNGCAFVVIRQYWAFRRNISLSVRLDLFSYQESKDRTQRVDEVASGY